MKFQVFVKKNGTYIELNHETDPVVLELIANLKEQLDLIKVNAGVKTITINVDLES